MRDCTIDGIGSLWGGKYGNVNVDGIGKVRGEIECDAFTVDGLLKGKGKLTVKELFSVDGIARMFRSVKAGQVKVDGILKLRRSSLTCENLNCDGITVCTRDINSDYVTVDGLISTRGIYGDSVEIKTDPDCVKNNSGAKVIKAGRIFSYMYFGRRVSAHRSVCDTIECTRLVADGLECKTVRANTVELTKCKIKTLYCTGLCHIDASCEIENIVK